MQRRFAIIGIVLVALAFIGLADSVYLTFEHYRGAPPVCIISDSPVLSVFDNCGKVTTSRYAEVFNIPVALAGVVYYAAALLLAVLALRQRGLIPLMLLAVLTSFGFFTSVWFVYLQIAVIKALCAYCIISALATTGLAALSLTAFFARRGEAGVRREEISSGIAV